jgi:hypothetical protein
VGPAAGAAELADVALRRPRRREADVDITSPQSILVNHLNRRWWASFLSMI